MYPPAVQTDDWRTEADNSFDTDGAFVRYCTTDTDGKSADEKKEKSSTAEERQVFGVSSCHCEGEGNWFVGSGFSDAV